MRSLRTLAVFGCWVYCCVLVMHQEPRRFSGWECQWLATGDTNQWVALTWPKPTHFTAVQLRGFQNNIERSVLQILATDGTTWMDVPNTVFVPFGSPKPDFLFPDGVMTTGLRLSMSATDSAGVPPGVSEILVFDTPLPKPAP